MQLIAQYASQNTVSSRSIETTVQLTTGEHTARVNQGRREVQEKLKGRIYFLFLFLGLLAITKGVLRATEAEVSDFTTLVAPRLVRVVAFSNELS